MGCKIRAGQTDSTIQASDGSRAYTGDVDAGSNKVVNVANGTDPSDAVNRSQLDAAILGVSWEEPVSAKDYRGTRTIAEIDAMGPDLGDVVVAGSAGTPAATGSDTLAIGDVAQYQGAVLGWQIVVANAAGFVPAGIRLLIHDDPVTLFLPLTEATDESAIAEFDGTSNTPDTITPAVDGMGIFVAGEGALNENFGYVFDTDAWIKFSGIQPGDLGDVGALSTIEAGDAAAMPKASGKAASDDHQHAIDTGAAVGLDANSTNTEGAGTPIARAAHTHAISQAGTLSTINAGDAAVDGAETGLANKGHQHAVATGAASGLSATTANSEGVSTNLARADHGHAIDTATGANSTIEAGDAAADGTAAGVSRKDHQHAVATGAPTVTVKSEATAAGEGTGGNLMRAGAQLQAATAAPTGSVSGSSTNTQGAASTLARSDHGHDLDSTGSVATVGAANAQGAGPGVALVDHVHEAPYFQKVESTETPLAGGADTDTGITFSKAAFRASGAAFLLTLNGQQQKLGDGSKVACFYPSNDNGVSAALISAIVTGTKLFNGTAADAPGTQVTDRVEIFTIAL